MASFLQTAPNDPSCTLTVVVISVRGTIRSKWNCTILSWTGALKGKESLRSYRLRKSLICYSAGSRPTLQPMLYSLCYWVIREFYFHHSCREQVRIPYDKPFIYLKGEGKRKTYVVWDAHDSTATSATFTSQADNMIAKCITFIVRISKISWIVFIYECVLAHLCATSYSIVDIHMLVCVAMLLSCRGHSWKVSFELLAWSYN